MARWAGYSRPDGPLGRLRTGLEAGKDPAADEAGWRLGLPERAWRLGARRAWRAAGAAAGGGNGATENQARGGFRGPGLLRAWVPVTRGGWSGPSRCRR